MAELNTSHLPDTVLKNSTLVTFFWEGNLNSRRVPVEASEANLAPIKVSVHFFNGSLVSGVGPDGILLSPLPVEALAPLQKYG